MNQPPRDNVDDDEGEELLTAEETLELLPPEEEFGQALDGEQ